MNKSFSRAMKAGHDRVVFARTMKLEDGLVYKEADGQHQHIVFDLGGGLKGLPAMTHPRTVCNMPFCEDTLASQHSEEHQVLIEYPRCPECFGPDRLTS